MKEAQISNQDSLDIIAGMLQSTRHNIAEDKVIYLLWGYGVAITAFAHYVLQFLLNTHPATASIVWLSMPVLGIVNGIYFSRKKKNKGVKTYIDRAMSAIWLSFIGALVCFLFAAPAVGWAVIYPMFMILYGIGSASSGGILKFNPLIFGGALSMIIGLIAFYQVFELQLILLAVAVVVSFVIPAHLLPKSKNA